MLENLKKYWFIGLIVLVMIVGTVIFSKEQLSSVFKGKKVDGKDLIYELAGENKNADDYYDEIVKDFGGSEGYKLFERLVLNSIETSDEVREESQKQADAHYRSVSSQGTAKVKELEDALKLIGYNGIDELNIFYENNAKLIMIQREYIDKKGEALYKDYFDAKSPRIVSHILVKMEDPKNPTEAELKNLEDAKAALEEGTDFADVAIKYSDDGSAADGGLIGFMDEDSQLVKEFIAAAITTESGQTSEWFETQYGQHIILVGATDYAGLKDDDSFISAIAKFNPEILFNSIWEKAQDLEIEFYDEDLKNEIKSYMKIEGVE